MAPTETGPYSPFMMDRDTVARFQFAGQDIPWLLDLWARTKPDHPLLIWEPKSGEERRWTYKEFNDEITRIAAGLHLSLIHI